MTREHRVNKTTTGAHVNSRGKVPKVQALKQLHEYIIEI